MADTEEKAMLTCRFCKKSNPYTTCPFCNLCRFCCNGALYNETETNRRFCVLSRPPFTHNGCVFMDYLVNKSENLFKNSRKESETFLENKSRRFMGCELESVGFSQDINGLNVSSRFLEKPEIPLVNKIALDNRSVVVYDGSVGSQGMEFCTLPTNGDEFIRQIDGLCDDLNEWDVKVDKSCGYHLHVDCSDFSARDLLNLIRIYYLIEPALFACVPLSRRNNHYCQPLSGKIKSLVINRLEKGIKDRPRCDRWMSQLAYGNLTPRKMKSAKMDKKPSSRYFAINTTSWFYRGTIEIRLAAGTFNREKIVNWAMFWSALCDKVKNNYNSLEKIRKNFGEMLDTHEKYKGVFNSGSWEALMFLCPSDSIRHWFEKRKETFAKVFTNRDECVEENDIDADAFPEEYVPMAEYLAGQRR